MCVWIDYWKVIVISGTYVAEPQPASKDHLHAAAADDDDGDDDDDKPGAADDAGPEKDTNSEQKDKMDTKSKHQNEDDAANTNNNADSDSEDGELSKTRSKSSKYFVMPQPPTSQLVMVIYGDLGKTMPLPLTAENPEDVLFEAGHADEFKVSHRICHGFVDYEM